MSLGLLLADHRRDVKTQSLDTTPEAERVLIEVVRRTPVWQRLAQVAALNYDCRRLALSDVRRLHPHADANEIRRELAARFLPPEIVAAVYDTATESERQSDDGRSA